MLLNKDGEQNLYNLFGLFSLICLLLSTSLFSDSFEEFKHIQDAAFAQYHDERDTAFNNYLKEEWSEYKSEYSRPLYIKKKPKNIIQTIKKEIKSVGPKISINLNNSLKKDMTAPIIMRKNTFKKDINFEFFGQKIGIDIDQRIKQAKFYPLKQSGIFNFFDVVASSSYGETVKEISKVSKHLGLNDWGIYQLVTTFSKSVFQNNDDINLFSWFLFNKLGFNVKVGIAKKHIILMHYSKRIIYSTPSYTFDGKIFYVLEEYLKGTYSKLYTYKQDYPQATKALDLKLDKLPNFKQNLKKKSLYFKQYAQKYSISYHYDQNLIDFMATYPQADYETYFNAPLSKNIYKEIAYYMKKHLSDKKASVAINFVLNFVQKAFVYETDEMQFGREKVMFSDETLYYEKSDCEDRAILFSYLVKELFGISVIGVKYDDHMATGLYIPMDGDTVKAGGRRFVIADPTYINANIGQSMPKYKSIIPKSFIFVEKG